MDEQRRPLHSGRRELDLHGERMRVLAISARPGDAEFACGGTLARIAGDGGAVAICTIANGNSSAADVPPRELAATRRTEAEQAAERLGAELVWLDHSDFAVSNDAVTRITVTDIVRAFDPNLVLAPAPLGSSQDIRNAWPLARAAVEMSAAPNARTDHDALPAAPTLMSYQPAWAGGFAPTAYVDVSGAVETKRAGLEAYVTLRAWIEEREGVDLIAAAHTVTAYRGLQAGVAHAEAFRADDGDASGLIRRLLP